MADNWQPIETAPQDGTVFQARNRLMDEPVKCQRGDYYPSWGGGPKVAWITVPEGLLMMPDEWRPA